jgi:hypothetical protein
MKNIIFNKTESFVGRKTSDQLRSQMLSVGTTASAGLKDWVHSFDSNLNVLESGLTNQNYDSTHIKTQCFTIAIVSFFELSEFSK